MKWLLILLFLTSCNANVSPSKWEAAIAACEQNKGLHYMTVSTVSSDTEIHCQNGFSRNMTQIITRNAKTNRIKYTYR